MENFLRIALAQINPAVGDLKANREKIINFILQAKGCGVDIVSFPELALTGYPPEDLLLKKHFIADNLSELKKITKFCAGITAIIGFAYSDQKSNIYNAAAIISHEEINDLYYKVNLPNYSVFDEERYFNPGVDAKTFYFGKVCFGVNICEDIWKRNGVANEQAKKGAKIIFNISSSPYHVGKLNLRRNILVERAKETHAYICYNNLVGGQDELVFDGSSLIISPEGETLALGKQFEEDLLIADIRMDELVGKTDNPRSLAKRAKPDLIKRENVPLNKSAEIYQALVLGTRDYIKKNGFKKVVIGLSGGIDSSLVAVIACDAIGKENVIGVSMPSRYSSLETQNDAKALAESLGIKLIVISIESIFKMYLAVLEKEFLGLERDATEENMQARIRGNILMALSNKFGWLVLTTGNKSETSVGYCTLYGDMAGGFAVIKDVPKTIVYELARFLNRRNKNVLIKESILNREPTAELRNNQKDSDSLPAYSVLDEILKEYVEEDKSLEEVVKSTRLEPLIVKEVIKKVDINEYKRRQSPPGIRITSKAFGKDRRLPITNGYREY